MEKKMTKEQALEELEHDVYTSNPYDLLDAVGVKTMTDESSYKFVNDEDTEEDKKKWEWCVKEMSEWASAYKKLNKHDRLTFSDFAIFDAKDDILRGTVLLVNGMNGTTKMSSQSLKHVMDLVQHLEDYYGARALITSVYYHSDVYYYTITFVIWSKYLQEAINNYTWGTYRPLYHQSFYEKRDEK